VINIDGCFKDIVGVINEESEPDNEVCSTYFESGSLLIDMKHEEDPLLIKFEKQVSYTCLCLCNIFPYSIPVIHVRPRISTVPIKRLGRTVHTHHVGYIFTESV
jgi:hypothetical protein